MKRTILLLAAALLSLGMIGCSTPATRIRDNPDVYAHLTPEQQAVVSSGQVALGLSMDAVKLALGAPDRVTNRVTREGQTTIWHYVDYEYVGGPMMYGGFYPGWRRGWGWDGWYPYYLDYPTVRHGRDAARVEFKGNQVTAFTSVSRY